MGKEREERTFPVHQWFTTSRLIKFGDTIEFDFFIPSGAESCQVDIFSRYLERYQTYGSFKADSDIAFLDEIESESFPIVLNNNRCKLIYKPGSPGNYIARLKVGQETLYRYFAVIDDHSVVVRFSTGACLDPFPNLHSTGIPLDYRLPVVRMDKPLMSYTGDSGQFSSDDPIFSKFLAYNRKYGDSIIPHLPDTPDLTVDQRVEYYGSLLDIVRNIMPDPDAVRSARVSMRHERDKGYVETFDLLGINDHCGLEESNAQPWLGMPEFPYFASAKDARKMNPDSGGNVVSHQWDFCGGWHFLGPAGWHYQMSDGNWDITERCIRTSITELQRMSELSGHPGCIFPLYDGVFSRDDPEFSWVERLQRLLAFELTKEYPVVFARSIDIADYYRKHFLVTPASVFVSETDHIEYDRHWLVGWNNHQVSVTQDRIPWDTSVSDIRIASKTGPLAYLDPVISDLDVEIFKDPVSTEYILVENQQMQVRFERECPLPIWYFNYSEQTTDENGSKINHSVTPDVRVERPDWQNNSRGIFSEIKIFSESTFANYSIVLWGLPDEFSPDSWDIEVLDSRYYIASNSKDEHHLVLIFDLKGNAVINVQLLAPATPE